MQPLLRVARAASRWIYAQPYLLLTFSGLAWAANAIAGRIAIGEVSPMAITCLRWTVVVTVLVVTTRHDILRHRAALVARWRALVLAGAFGFTAFNALFYVAAHHTSAVNIGLIQGIIPAIVLAAGVVAFRTPVGRLQIAGVVVTIAGVLAAVSRGDIEVLRRLAFNAGDVMMVAASVFYAAYTLWLRRRPPVPPLVLFAALAMVALVTSMPLLAVEVAAGDFIAPGLTGWALIVFIGLVPSLVAQLSYMRGIELIGPARAGLFINLVPVFAALLAVVVLREPFAAYHALALALVLGGIALSEMGRPGQA